MPRVPAEEVGPAQELSDRASILRARLDRRALFRPHRRASRFPACPVSDGAIWPTLMVLYPSPDRSGRASKTLIDALRTLAQRCSREEDGQGLAEYALILALIAIVAILSMIFLGDVIADLMDTIGSTIDAAT